MKRRILKLAAFLLLGAIVNVAVAWGCAMILAEQTDNWNMRGSFARLEDDYVWLVYRQDRPGYFSIESYVWLIVMEEDERWDELGTLIENWSRIPDRNDPSGEPRNWEESASGWPVASMWSRLTELDPLHWVDLPNNPRVLPRDKLERGWLVDWSFLPNQIILPIGLIWSGIVINTLFYAVLLWLVTLGQFTLRRYIRREHGRCIKCGYDVRHMDHDACPECGTAVLKEAIAGQSRGARARSAAMRAWYPGKRAVWWGILGFLIAFIAYGEIAYWDIAYWDTSRWYWVFPGFGAGLIIGSIACFIGGVTDKKRE